MPRETATATLARSRDGRRLLGLLGRLPFEQLDDAARMLTTRPTLRGSLTADDARRLAGLCRRAWIELHGGADDDEEQPVRVGADAGAGA